LAGPVVDTAEEVVGAEVTPRVGTRHRWGWRFLWDAVVVYSVYQLYELVRAKVAGSSAAAFHNAQHIVALERALHLYWEHGVQQHLLAHTRVLQFWDIYYGSIHFGVPVVVLVVLYHRWPERYRRCRNVLGWTVGIALVSFALYPLMPPRLMPSSYGFVDTAARLGGLGPLDRGSLKDVENLYAAMPSLHIGWSTWSAFALVPVLRRWWAKGLLVAYPFLTLVAVVVTANHWILDAVGGLIALGLGYLATGAWDARRNRSTALRTTGAG
jgi:membrane-associated phospholipid phosphatase